jgi:hypothetical protein
MSWTDLARAHIAEIHEALPPTATFQERDRALREAYPFGKRSGWAYKAWLRARKEYLAKFTPPGKPVRSFPLSPLERLIARSR